MKLYGHRNTIRLQKYDYSDEGWYFVTICSKDRECLFGDISVGATRGSPFQIVLNDFGNVINNIWATLPKHHNVELDEHIIMPNHIHFIIHILYKGGSRPAPTLNTVTSKTPALGTIIGLFKSECTKQIRKLIKNPQFNVWQRSYYEHIIRNKYELNRIREYIGDNPKNWEMDVNYL